MGNFFKVDAPRKKRLFARRKKQNGSPNHVPLRTNFLGKRGTTFLQKKAIKLP